MWPSRLDDTVRVSVNVLNIGGDNVHLALEDVRSCFQGHHLSAKHHAFPTSLTETIPRVDTSVKADTVEEVQEDSDIAVMVVLGLIEN